MQTCDCYWRRFSPHQAKAALGIRAPPPLRLWPLATLATTPAALPAHQSRSGAEELRSYVRNRDGAGAAQALRALQGGQVPRELGDDLLTMLCRGGHLAAAWQAYRLVDVSALEFRTQMRLMNAAIKAKDPHRALRVFRDLQGAGHRTNVVTWCNLISAFCRFRRKGMRAHETAYSLWQEMLASGLELDDAACYAAGMNACIRVGRTQEAEALLHELLARPFLQADVRVFNILLKGYAASGDLGRFDGVLADIRAAGLAPTAPTYNTIINTYVDAGRMEEAQEKLVEARLDGVVLDVWTYSTLIKGYVQRLELRQALAILAQMRASEIRPNVVTYTTLIDGCVRGRVLDQAEALLDEMIAAGIRPNAVTFNALLHGHASSPDCDLKDVTALLGRMGETGLQPSSDTFNILMHSCLQRREPEGVPGLFEQLRGFGLQPDSLSYTALIAALARLSRTDDALAAFEQMEADVRVRADPIALNVLIFELVKLGLMESAERFLGKANELARSEGKSPPVEAYGAVIIGYAQQRNVDATLQCIHEFIAAGGRPDAYMFDSAVNVCVQAGQFKRGLSVIRAVERRGERLDRERIKRTVHAVESAYRKSRTQPGRNSNLERIKFWLGLPNTYYDPL